MITGEIATLFASAAGIGAAAATWVCDRRLAKRLTDLRRDVENLKDRIRDLDYQMGQTETAIGRLSVGQLGPLLGEDHLNAKVSEAFGIGPELDNYERFVSRLYRSPAPAEPRPVGKSPDLAAPFTRGSFECGQPSTTPLTKHPLYAKTGLPNQPVASLRPEAPKPCTKCGKPRVWTAGKLYGKDATLAHCRVCQEAETPDGSLEYCGYPLKPESSDPASQSLRPNWDCPTCSYRSYQPRAGNLRCPICKGLEIIE